jgi:hypothetical protein
LWSARADDPLPLLRIEDLDGVVMLVQYPAYPIAESLDFTLALARRHGPPRTMPYEASDRLRRVRKSITMISSDVFQISNTCGEVPAVSR